MHRPILIFCTQLLFISACHFKSSNKDNSIITDTAVTTQFIPLDTANKMIGSYKESLDTTAAVAGLYSVSFNAAQLRAYLADTTIVGMKISMAHTLAYINAGHRGQAAGYRSDALTFIISAYNASGNFVYHNSQVMDFGAQCPTVCPAGQAGNVLFPISTTSDE
jgi:hypothetical protein